MYRLNLPALKTPHTSTSGCIITSPVEKWEKAAPILDVGRFFRKLRSITDTRSTAVPESCAE